ncbi:hypothetical protein LEMLEM_LOCUS13046 [Lemmus lemmus]
MEQLSLAQSLLSPPPHQQMPARRWNPQLAAGLVSLSDGQPQGMEQLSLAQSPLSPPPHQQMPARRWNPQLAAGLVSLSDGQP